MEGPWTQSMDPVHGPGPWTRSMDPVHGPGPWTRSMDPVHILMDPVHVHGGGPWTRGPCFVLSREWRGILKMFLSNIRTHYGTAVYIKSDLNCSEIWHDVTVVSHPFPSGRISQLIDALAHLHKSVLTKPTIAIILFGELNINNRTTDHRKQIDHIYTNIPKHVQSAGTLESYYRYSDHRPIHISQL